jgi:hypothetical protein
MPNLSLEWFGSERDETRRKNFEGLVRNSSLVLGRLYEIATEWEEEIARSTKLDDFETPSWSHKQAFRNGELNRIRRLKALLSFLKGDIT